MTAMAALENALPVIVVYLCVLACGAGFVVSTLS